MTKSIVRLALVGAAAASFAMPHAASAQEAPCAGTFVVECVQRTVNELLTVSTCVDVGTFPVCLTK